ncbi:DEAD/DEAH box helicase [Hydrogeniiclostridium mannosilyticum]|uniref:DEAD/DEAH box helicase n=1 Tax=Hydrogeniiclostridium mannosilyticum TaxID=2764322 RepID=UPI00399B68C8
MDKRNFASMIVKYWYLIEFLGQSDFPVQSREGRELCKKAANGEARLKQLTVYHILSAQADTNAKDKGSIPIGPYTALQNDAHVYSSYGVLSDEIHICLGKMERYLFAERLQQAFHQDLELPEKNYKPVCLIGLKCDEQGKYIPDSIQVSPLAWGIHQLLNHAGELTKENMADFISMDAYESDMQFFDNQMVEVTEEGRVGLLLTSDLLNSIRKQVERRYLVNIIPPEQEINWDGVMIYRRYRTEDSKVRDIDVFHDSDLANSFFADDLHMVEKVISSGEFGKNPLEKAVLDYITGAYAEENPVLHWLNFQNRIDVHSTWKNGRKDERADFFHRHLDIAKAPLGKWPSKFMPCLMQQLAVNLCWCPSPDNMPIFSVNGPPGTGKTTLLKEIIAGNVVERADLLAQYQDPDNAFILRHFQDGDKMHRGYSQYCWGYYDFADERLKDYGMLVASCNNAAVENITKELPDGGALLKGMEPSKNENEAVRQGLLEVQELFQIDAADKETYKVWNQERYESKIYPDIYFTKLANDLAKRKDEEWDRWGLISAPFGKMSNLKEYMYAVLKTYIRSFGSNDSIQQHKEDYVSAIQRFKRQYEKVRQMEKELQQISGARKRFTEQRASLNNQAQRTRKHQSQRERDAEEMQKELQKLAQQLRLAEQTLKDYEIALAGLRQRKSLQDGNQANAENQIQKLRQQIIELENSRRFRDVILEIFHRPTMLARTIQEQYQALAKAEQNLQDEAAKTGQLQQELERQSRKCDVQGEAISGLENEQNQLLKKRQTCLEQVNQLRLQMKKCTKKIAAARKSYLLLLKAASERQADQAMTVLNDEFFRQYDSGEDKESTAAQVANPWHTAAYNREREKLFYEALKLHKAFLLGSKACLWNFKNLLLLWKEPRDDDDKKAVTFSLRDREAAFGSLLNTVFLLTPVLSTTFASAGNMLSSIRQPGEIGCLIIDEAGQTAPQMALGSLFRCRRAVVVGDPKQVEPVVTDELDLIKRVIQNDYTGYYQSKTHSVQGFADRLNTVGTTYADGEQKTWVGCPLAVHRRCISPMFELSNALSYNHMMKQQTALPEPEKEAAFCRRSSGWINVSGSENSRAGKDHFVETQGRKAWELIREAFRLTEEIPSLFVISPFTTVRDGMKKMIRSQPEYREDNRLSEWVDHNIGTVHTFQGKEADQVIFLLGCDKNALPAVRWVNTNIVNVAATRAKYRLYVIGDYTVWQHSALFRKVKGVLDSYALRALQKAADNPDAPRNEKQIARLFQEVPGSDSLTMDGEFDDSLVAPLFQELDGLWKNSSLTPAQLAAFGLSASDIKSLPPMIQQRLTSSILLHELFAMMRERYGLEEIDASCTGILFCKTMESMLKEMLLGKLKTLFPGEKTNKGKLCDIKEQQVTTGTFTSLLNKEELRSRLASRRAILFEQVCDKQWWKTYAGELEKFRELRNTCCHSEPLSWQQEDELIQILFERREFMKTLIGKAL